MVNDHEKVRKINIGQSGADVFELEGSRILKRVVRDRIDNGMFDTYVKEALFYQSECPKSYLPEVENIEISPDGIVLVMKKYKNPDRKDFSEELLGKITNVLASIHATSAPAFLTEDDIKTEVMTKEDIAECVKGWLGILDEHPGMFDSAVIDNISQNINDIIGWHDSEKRVLSHGDFHWDNILTDDNGRILVCDWQNVGLRGASDDLSFFMSRLGADGISVDSHSLLTRYALEYNRLTGETLAADELERHIKASNVITSFRFWHIYLHGSDTERVRDIFGKMVSDYKDCWGYMI